MTFRVPYLGYALAFYQECVSTFRIRRKTVTGIERGLSIPRQKRKERIHFKEELHEELWFHYSSNWYLYKRRINAPLY